MRKQKGAAQARANELAHKAVVGLVIPIMKMPAIFKVAQACVAENLAEVEAIKQIREAAVAAGGEVAA